MNKACKYIPLVLLLWISTITASAFAPIMNTDNRTFVSLDGMWKYIIDPLETGYYDYRMKPSAEGFFLDKPQNNPDLIEYDFDKTPSLFVPRDWNTQTPELLYYEGCVWYRNKINIRANPAKRYFLHFGAINYEAIVYLNGVKLGTHIGGYTPFNFEVTGNIKNGINSVVIKADNKRRLDGVPTSNFDWWNYGGITRSVKLLETPDTFVREYSVQLSKNNNKLIEGWVQLDGNEPGTAVKIEIPELKKQVIVKPGKDGFARFQFTANPVLWDIENPKLYKVNISTPNEVLTDEIGFRTISTSGNKILLNGKPVFCRGICIHEEAPLRSGGRAHGSEDARTLLTWAKEMGCNFARLAHYTHNEFMIKEAERMGIMLWSEVPVYWTIDWKNPDVLANAKQQMMEMVSRDRNRCNIIIWSVANETPQSDERFAFLKELVGYTRSLDNTRLISAALEKEEIQPGLMTVHDPLGEYLDVFSFNQYVGWYDGLPEKCDRVNWKLPADKPIIVSEFGGGALYGKHGDKSERWTEEYQADMYEASIRMLKRMEGLAGSTPWLLMDFRSPKRPLSGIQDNFNRKGVVSNFGKKKQAFFVMKKWYDEIKDTYK